MRRLLKVTHAYVGFALSLLLFVLAVTGGALVYKEAYWRMVYPELRGEQPVITPSGHAAAIAAAVAAFGDRVNSVKMPEPGVRAYHLYMQEGEAFLSVGDHRVIDEWHPTDRLMAFLFDLHAHFMAGDAGERVGGVISLFGAFLALTGLVLWWPARRRFAWASFVPRDLGRRSLIAWHRDLGVVSTPILLVLLLSGSGLVFYATAQTLLNGVFGDSVPAVGGEIGTVDLSGTLAGESILSRVEAEFPDARLVFYYPPKDGVTIHEFRLKQPCELHPNGRSYLHLDGTGRVLYRADACALPPGERTVHAFYPLHSGKTESGLYKIAVLFGAIALAVLSFSGALAYGRQLGWLGRARKTESRARESAPSTP